MIDTIPFSPADRNTDLVGPEIQGVPPWTHLHLGHEDRGALINYPTSHFAHRSWEQIRDFLPDDLRGCTALDLGCGNGLLSIELARRGAEVTAIDSDEEALEQAHRAIVQHGLQDRITLHQGSAYDLLASETPYDVVLAFDLLEHARYPMLALDAVARVVKRCLIIQAAGMDGHEIEFTPEDLPSGERTALGRAGWPKMAFVEKALAGDPDRWWAPNRACIAAMVRSAGLEIAAHPGEELLLCQPRATGTAGSAGTDELAQVRGPGAQGPARFQPADAVSPRNADVAAGAALDAPAA